MSEQNFVCSEVLDISSVADLYQQLDALLQSGQPVMLEASAVERVDTAAMQLLVAFFREAKNRQLEVSWKSPASALQRAASTLGVQQILGFAA